MLISKWEKTVQCRPVHNIISSDFPKYYPQPWKYMEGQSRIEYLMSYEYLRMWLEERTLWQKRMYPENKVEHDDVVKSYVAKFKSQPHTRKPTKKELFKMKKFKDVGSKITNKRPPGDKAINLNNVKTPANKS